jgi:hypothetical protein
MENGFQKHEKDPDLPKTTKHSQTYKASLSYSWFFELKTVLKTQGKYSCFSLGKVFHSSFSNAF